MTAWTAGGTADPSAYDIEYLEALSRRLVPGGCILKEPATPPAVWGHGEEVLWAEGESLIIAGPDGTGKTTLAGNLVRARLGIGDGVVLGMPVAVGRMNVLYLAMDRPRQARRALGRLFTDDDIWLLDERLKIWNGPPPRDLAREPGLLRELARLAGADTVFVDSLKDAALKLSDDETGSGWNRARQLVIACGCELCELHHPRKAQSDNKKPSKLEDLYGSRWITSGAGSVVSLWGEPGDPIVEFSHLKQPAAAVGPWKVGINADAGTVHHEDAPVDLLDQIRLRGPNGITADVAAMLLFGKEDRNAVKKAEYRLNKKVSAGFLYRRDGQHGGGPGRERAAWFLLAKQAEKQAESGEW